MGFIHCALEFFRSDQVCNPEEKNETAQQNAALSEFFEIDKTEVGPNACFWLKLFCCFLGCFIWICPACADVDDLFENIEPERRTLRSGNAADK